MKTAEDWDKFFSERYDARKHPEWKTKSDLEMFSDMCSHIQLDAFKAGAEWAAKIVCNATVPQKDTADYWHNIALQLASREINIELVKMKEIPK